MGLIFLSEYSSQRRNAHVLRNLESGYYFVSMSEQGKESMSIPFDHEIQAEEFAEDWVLAVVK